MNRSEKYDRIYLGAITGFLAPVLIGLVVYLLSKEDKSLFEYFRRIVYADILTHIISLCVFPNIFLFLVFNRLDMLRATRGVLGITLFWAILVFSVKFLL
jgi:hypothetical protein